MSSASEEVAYQGRTNGPGQMLTSSSKKTTEEEGAGFLQDTPPMTYRPPTQLSLPRAPPHPSSITWRGATLSQVVLWWPLMCIHMSHQVSKCCEHFLNY